MRTLFVVSGGDAPGINTLIGQYVVLCESENSEAFGAVGGFSGLLKAQVKPLNFQDMIPWLGRSGSIIPSSRDPVLGKDQAERQLKDVLAKHKIDSVVIFGGNGTLRHIPPLLLSWGIPFIGIPTTIDNDVPGTELTLGFDSACNFAYHAIDGALATAHALPGRIFLIETLGGSCGNLALAIAEGSGAHAVILPEYEYRDEWLTSRAKVALERHGYALIVICEGARGARILADELPEQTGVRVRDVRLGHAQRGAMPSHRDRTLAAQMAKMSYSALKSGLQFGTVVVRQGEMRIETEPLPGSAPLPDRLLYNAINGLGGPH